MIYVYDILLNFSDDKRVLEFFEWGDNDLIDHIKKIPLYRVSSKVLDDLINSNIRISIDFVNKINNKTLVYKSSNTIKYAALFCDTNRALGVIFNDNGDLLDRSYLMLDEEEEVLDDTLDLEEYDLNYLKKDKFFNNYFLTRDELFRQKYLLLEINNLNKNKLYDKLSYLYDEVFGEDELSISDKYNNLIKDIKDNYDSRYNYLYNIVRLSYSKKK